MRTLHISPVDTLFAGGRYPIEFMIYYQRPLPTAGIRSALKALSSAFWPMFGRYQSGILHESRYSEQLFYDEEQVNESFDPQAPIAEIFENNVGISSELQDRLFCLKIRHLKNGSILVPKMSHLAGDGYSYFYFLSVLALSSQKYRFPFRNIFIRRFYRPHLQRNIYQSTDLTDVEPDISGINQRLSIHYLSILRSFLNEKLKEAAKKFNFRISQNDLLSAMVLKQYLKNQKKNPHKNIQLTIPIDVRRQIKQYGNKFFGNGLMFAKSDFTTEELNTLAEYDIAVKIRQLMPEINDEIYSRYVNHLKSLIENKDTDQLRPYDPDKGCLVTNLSRLPVKKLDFGAGRPDFVFPLTVEKNSAVVLADDENYILRIVS